MEARALVLSALAGVMLRAGGFVLLVTLLGLLLAPLTARAALPSPPPASGWWEFIYVPPGGYQEGPRPQLDADEPGTNLYVRCVELEDGTLSACSAASWWADFVYDPLWWEQSGWACVPGYPDDCGSALVIVYTCDVWESPCAADWASGGGGGDPDPEPGPDSGDLLAAAQAAASAADSAAAAAAEASGRLQSLVAYGTAVLALGMLGLAVFGYSIGARDA